MKVYVLVCEPFHEVSTVGDVFASPELAMRARPGDWQRTGFYVANREGCVAQRDDDDSDDTYMILEREVKGG